MRDSSVALALDRCVANTGFKPFAGAAMIGLAMQPTGLDLLYSLDRSAWLNERNFVAYATRIVRDF
jgi:hypothetical protein